MMARVAKAYEGIGFRDSISLKLVVLLIVLAVGSVFLRLLSPNSSVDGIVGSNGVGILQVCPHKYPIY